MRFQTLNRSLWMMPTMAALMVVAARVKSRCRPDTGGPPPTPSAPPSAPASTTIASELPAPDPDALARYVPGEKLALLIEFPGLDAQADAWKGTAAATILSETKTGAMFDEILMQLHAQIVAATGPSPITSEQEVAMLRHLLRRGVVLGVTADREQPAAGGAVLVLRDAFANEVKPLFARQLLDQMQEGVKPEMLDKPGGRRVAVTRLKSTNQPVAWWVEDRRDIVLVVPPSHVDAVLNTMTGKSPDATTVSRRQALSASTGGFRPLAWGYLDFREAPPLPQEAARWGLDTVAAIAFRWGAEGRAIRTEVDLEVPAPRRGLLALLEQPPFGASAVPPIPEGVEGVSMISLDPNETLARLTDWLTQLGMTDAIAGIKDLETAFKQSTRLELRRDLLAHLGPRVLTYSLPQKRNGLAALNSLNPLAGFQLPRLVVMVDIKDAKALNQSMTQLISFANKQLALLEVPAADAGATTAPPASGAGGAAKAKANRFEFKMSSSKPLTYQLNMPAQFAALFQAKPTVALGARRLVIATAPDLAADAIKGDEDPDASWSPGPEMSEALSGLGDNLIYLQVVDTKEALPKAIAELPGAINRAAMAIVAGRMPPEAAGGGQAAAPSPIVQVVIPPDKLPKASEIMPHVFAGSSAFGVDDRGFRLVMRDAFFDITSITAVLNGLAQAPAGSVGPLPFGSPGGAPGRSAQPSIGADGGRLSGESPGGRRGSLGPEVMPPGGAAAGTSGGGSRRGGLRPEVGAPPGGGGLQPAAPSGGRRGGLGPEAAPPAGGGGRPSVPD